MKVKGRRGNFSPYTFDDVVYEAVKYNSSIEWRNASPSTYKWASDRGVLREICETNGLEIKPRNSYTKEQCIEAAKTVDSPYQFRIHFPRLYSWAYRHGFLDELFDSKKRKMTSPNTVYVFRCYNLFDGSPIIENDKHLFKIGITYDLDRRQRELQKNNGFGFDLVLVKDGLTPIKARSLEKQLLKHGSKSKIKSGDGFTEFRCLTEVDFEAIKTYFTNKEILL